MWAAHLTLRSPNSWPPSTHLSPHPYCHTLPIFKLWFPMIGGKDLVKELRPGCSKPSVAFSSHLELWSLPCLMPANCSSLTSYPSTQSQRPVLPVGWAYVHLRSLFHRPECSIPLQGHLTHSPNPLGSLYLNVTPLGGFTWLLCQNNSTSSTPDSLYLLILLCFSS